jgi:hypothetical protein
MNRIFGLIILACLGLLIVVSSRGSKVGKINAVVYEKVKDVAKPLIAHSVEKELELTHEKIAETLTPKLDPLHQMVEEYRDLSSNELQERLTELTTKLDEGQWVARANAGELTSDEMDELVELMQNEDALKLVALERNVEKAEREIGL